MASSSSTSVQQQNYLFSQAVCKCSSPIHILNFHSLSLIMPFPLRSLHAKLHAGHPEISLVSFTTRNRKQSPSGFPSNVYMVANDSAKDIVNDRRLNNTRKLKRSVVSSRSSSSLKSKYHNLGLGSEEKVEKLVNDTDHHYKVRAKIREKLGERTRVSRSEAEFRAALDMCSKRGDVSGAIQLYDKALREGIMLEQYHYNVLLYLCSSAAIGVVRPAKSGSRGRTLENLGIPGEVSGVVGEKGEGTDGVVGLNSPVQSVDITSTNHMSDTQESSSRDGFDDISSSFHQKENLLQLSSRSVRLKIGNDLDKDGDSKKGDREIHISEEIKKYSLHKGFEIYEKMCLDNVPMNEASLTAVGRMAMSMGNGDMAFDVVKKMKQLGINPRLRSYGPALSVFCYAGDVDKAFDVEKHMLENGVYPEEPELEALLRVSVFTGRGDKVYYLLHKLRTSVRKVSPSTAETIMKWFSSKVAARLGKRKWDHGLIMKAMKDKGGGWHGQGWLGKGKWAVSRSTIGTDALCQCCGEKLAIIDLDPIESENFAESVASIAIKRDRNSSFQKFQKWLDYYGPFEAVIDAANVGLSSQNKFKPSRVNAVVNGIRHKLPSKKWPLIVVHNKRIIGHKMDQRMNKAVIEKWKTADALYATPSGSNDDWYWLYAAIKFKSLIVTNDEMRDNTFHLLGNDFFPRWKERHQVRFYFSDAGPEFYMPPPYSVVIQESENGNWHIPVASEHDREDERTWLCITRVSKKNSAARPEKKANSTFSKEVKIKSPLLDDTTSKTAKKLEKKEYNNLRNILLESISSAHQTILPKLEASEKLAYAPQEPENEKSKGFQFTKSLQELRDLRSQLHYAADYCEETFLNSNEKREVVDSTKEYICRAIVTVVDHLGSVSANLDHCIADTDAITDADLRINSIKHRLLCCQKYAHKLALNRRSWSVVLPRHHRRYLLTSTSDTDKSTEESRNSKYARTTKITNMQELNMEDLPFFMCTHKEKFTIDSALAFPVRDGISVQSKEPNPTFHFQQLGSEKHGRKNFYRKALPNTEIMSLIRRIKLYDMKVIRK